MKLTQLEKCLHIISYWLHEDDSVINKVLNTETPLTTHYIQPFSKELNINLLNKDTIEGKRGLIKFYVFEFWELQSFFSEYHEILFTGSYCNYTPLRYEFTSGGKVARKLSEFENYVVNSWELFNMLFNEIQLSCIKYSIDFLELCNDLNFSTKFFDNSITLAFNVKENDNLTPQQNRTKQVIAETFENMDKKGWQYAFSTEQDYNLFTDLLTNFFEYKDYLIPETAIQLKRTCKTKVAKTLGEIHAELSDNPLNSDIEYFKIVKVLNHFKEVSNFDLVKAMQR